MSGQVEARWPLRHRPNPASPSASAHGPRPPDPSRASPNVLPVRRGHTRPTTPRRPLQDDPLPGHRPTGVRVCVTPQGTFARTTAGISAGGRGWGTSGPPALPVAAPGARFPGCRAGGTCGTRTARSAMARGPRLTSWCASSPAWPRGWAGGHPRGGLRSPRIRSGHGG